MQQNLTQNSNSTTEMFTCRRSVFAGPRPADFDLKTSLNLGPLLSIKVPTRRTGGRAYGGDDVVVFASDEQVLFFIAPLSNLLHLAARCLSPRIMELILRSSTHDLAPDHPLRHRDGDWHYQ